MKKFLILLVFGSEKSRVSIAGAGVGSSQCAIRSVSFSASVRPGLGFVGVGSQAWSFFFVVFCSSLRVFVRCFLYRVARTGFCAAHFVLSRPSALKCSISVAGPIFFIPCAEFFVRIKLFSLGIFLRSATASFAQAGFRFSICFSLHSRTGFYSSQQYRSGFYFAQASKDLFTVLTIAVT
jgi:hypothetical protein